MATARAAGLWVLLPLAVGAVVDGVPVGDGCRRATTPEARLACMPGAREPGAVARILFGGGLDPARARAEDWTLVPGIGPVRARALVAEAGRRPFRRLEDLARARGIGPRTVERLRGWVEFPEPPADP